MRTLAITGMLTVFMISRIIFGEAMRATPPAARMSSGTRSRAMTATAPASSAIRACSALVTSITTPPFCIFAKPRLSSSVPDRILLKSRSTGMRGLLANDGLWLFLFCGTASREQIACKDVIAEIGSPETLKTAARFLAIRAGRLRHRNAGLRQRGSPGRRAERWFLDRPDGGRRPRGSSSAWASDHRHLRGRARPCGTSGPWIRDLGREDAPSDSRRPRPGGWAAGTRGARGVPRGVRRRVDCDRGARLAENAVRAHVAPRSDG